MAYLWIILGLVLLMVGADLLVRGAAAFALRVGITPLVVGLTVVAFGTSSPELAVGAQASLGGQGDITLGTVIGSNICNILLILGLGCVIRPITIHLQVLRFDLPVLVVITVGVSAVLTLGELSRFIGFVLLATIISYIWLTIYMARKDMRAGSAGDYEEMPSGSLGIPLIVLFLIVGPVMLTVGSDWVLRGATEVARAWGVSEVVIGLTLVAVSGSLPELATTVAAAVKGKGDIAIGNVIGSNIFNLLCVLGFSAIAAPIPVQNITIVDVGTMIAVTVLLVPLMRMGFTLRRWEGVLMLGLYGLYIGYLLLGHAGG